MMATQNHYFQECDTVDNDMTIIRLYNQVVEAMIEYDLYHRWMDCNIHEFTAQWNDDVIVRSTVRYRTVLKKYRMMVILFFLLLR